MIDVVEGRGLPAEEATDRLDVYASARGDGRDQATERVGYLLLCGLSTTSLSHTKLWQRSAQISSAIIRYRKLKQTLVSTLLEKSGQSPKASGFLLERVIKTEQLYGGSAYRGPTCNPYFERVPAEVLLPAVNPRIKETYQLAGPGIGS